MCNPVQAFHENIKSAGRISTIPNVVMWEFMFNCTRLMFTCITKTSNSQQNDAKRKKIIR